MNQQWTASSKLLLALTLFIFVVQGLLVATIFFLEYNDPQNAFYLALKAGNEGKIAAYNLGQFLAHTTFMLPVLIALYSRKRGWLIASRVSVILLTFGDLGKLALINVLIQGVMIFLLFSKGVKNHFGLPKKNEPEISPE